MQKENKTLKIGSLKKNNEFDKLSIKVDRRRGAGISGMRKETLLQNKETVKRSS